VAAFADLNVLPKWLSLAQMVAGHFGNLAKTLGNLFPKLCTKVFTWRQEPVLLPGGVEPALCRPTREASQTCAGNGSPFALGEALTWTRLAYAAYR